MLKYLLKNYILPFKYRFLLGFIILIFNSILTVILPITIMNAIDKGIKIKNILSLNQYVIEYIVIFILIILSLYFLTVVLETLGLDLLYIIKSNAYKKVINWDYEKFSQIPVGKLVSRIEGDSEKVRFFFVTAVVAIFESIFMFFGMIFVMYQKSAPLTYIVISVVPIIIILTYFMQKFVFPKFKFIRKMQASIIAKITEYLSALDILKVYNKEKYYFEKFDDENKKKYIMGRNIEFLSITFFNFIFMTQEIVIALILKSGGSLILKGALTYGTLVLFIEYIKRFFQPLIAISEQIVEIQRAIASFSRVYELDQTEAKIKSGTKKLDKIKNEIRFENLSFSYNPKEPVLKNISFTISVGEKWAIVGETGGGKSTLIKLLLRFYEATEGKIYIDGIGINEIDFHSLRKDIALIEQEFYLFPATVLDNLRLFDDTIPREKIIDICKKIKIDDFIRKFPQGYDTYLSEDGINISTGEKQLLSIARAMVKDADIVLMDEATSSIDPHTEKTIENAIDILLKGKTSIIIAHRLSTIKNADKIVVIDKGEIAEIGNHEELMIKKGVYYKLYTNQETKKVDIK